MAGVLIQRRQIDADHGRNVLTLLKPGEVQSPVFTVQETPYTIHAYGLVGAQEARLYSATVVNGVLTYTPFVFNGVEVVLTAQSPNSIVALTGAYLVRTTASAVSVFAVLQKTKISKAHPVKSDAVYSYTLAASTQSETIQVTEIPLTIFLTDNTVSVSVYTIRGSTLTPYAVGGVQLVLDSNNTVTTLDKTANYVLISDSDTVVAVKPNYVAFTNPYALKGEKGDTGAQGPAGDAGTLTMVAGEASMSALRAVVADGGGRVVRYPDVTVAEDATKLVGISITSATLGNSIDIQTGNIITDAAWNWASGMVFVGVNGVLTQTPPVGWLADIGRAISATEILINIRQPVIRS